MTKLVSIYVIVIFLYINLTSDESCGKLLTKCFIVTSTSLIIFILSEWLSQKLKFHSCFNDEDFGLGQSKFFVVVVKNDESSKHSQIKKEVFFYSLTLIKLFLAKTRSRCAILDNIQIQNKGSKRFSRVVAQYETYLKSLKARQRTNLSENLSCAKTIKISISWS